MQLETFNKIKDKVVYQAKIRRDEIEGLEANTEDELMIFREWGLITDSEYYYLITILNS
jgi:hypothetical protein